MELDIEYVPIADITPYEGNAKEHPVEQIEQICESIKQFGMNDPIAIDKNGTIIEGHGRYLACKRMSVDTVPIIRLDHLSDEQRRAYTLVHNKLTMNSGFNLDILASELDELADFDMEAFGFDLEELEQELAGIDKEVEEVETPADAESKVKKGQIWKLGNHRLMCGDCTKKENVEKLMNGNKADMVFTDPPYGMKKEKDGVQNDNLNYDDLLEFNKKWIPLTFGASKDNGSWYCWGIDEPLMDIYSNILKPMARENKITFRNLITWDKSNGQGQLAEEFRMYPIADEKCLFVMSGEQDMKYKRNLPQFNDMFEPIRKWFEDEKMKSGLSVKEISKIDSTRCSHYWAKVQFEFPTEQSFSRIRDYCIRNNINAFNVEYEEIKKEYEEIKKEYEEIKKEFYKSRAYFNNIHDNMNNVWHFDRVRGEEREGAGGHATPKPIALCGRAIKTSSREDESVLDVFGGSGSTLIACEQLNRNCYMMELDPHYCDVIIKRWEDFTGNTAELIGEDN